MAEAKDQPKQGLSEETIKKLCKEFDDSVGKNRSLGAFIDPKTGKEVIYIVHEKKPRVKTREE